MPNHVQIVAVPRDEHGLWRTFRFVHPHYTGFVNARMRSAGHPWQGRFGSVAMDEAHLVAALRYVALNPVRAGLGARAEDWRWSSTAAHMAARDDGVVTVALPLERVGDFATFLGASEDDDRAYAALRRAESTGRPVGSSDWLHDMTAKSGLPLMPRKPRSQADRRHQIGGMIANVFATYGGLPYAVATEGDAYMVEGSARTGRVEARIAPEALSAIRRAAEIEGRSLSDFVADAARRAAERTIEQAQIIRLSLADQERVATILLDPPRRTRAFARAVEAHARLIATE